MTKTATINIKPIELRDANEFIAKHHRHHKPVVGHRFSLSAWKDGRIVGVAIAGRPVARLAGSPLEVLEVTRLCTDGTYNACSILYARVAAIAKLIGFNKIQTYILETESGSSLRASGWENCGLCGGGQWKHTDGKPRRKDQPTCRKVKYQKILNNQEDE